MRDLRIGDRVRTPDGVGEVTGFNSYSDAVRVDGHWWDADGHWWDADGHWWDADDLIPLRRDIPREHVADLHAAVATRVEQLAAHGGGTVGTWLHAELSEVAEALRLLLEEEVRDGE